MTLTLHALNATTPPSKLCFFPFATFNEHPPPTVVKPSFNTKSYILLLLFLLTPSRSSLKPPQSLQP